MAPVVVPWADNVPLTSAANSAAPRNVQREIFIQWGSLFDEMPGVGIALGREASEVSSRRLENLGANAGVWVALGKACRPRVAQGEQRRKGLRFQARGNLE